MITFILNHATVHVDLPPGTPLLQAIRNVFRLTGSKLACGEGECGACTVMVGTLARSGMQYHTVNSCITPLLNVRNRHVVTVEGINSDNLTPVQEAMVNANGTQCGFCTPGFVMSMTCGLLNDARPSGESLIAAMDGNICRCTGYKSIERAATLTADQVGQDASLDTLITIGVVPPWFNEIPERITALEKSTVIDNGEIPVGGGTDLYVQRPHEMPSANVQPLQEAPALHGIRIEDGVCTIGAGETMSTLQQSELLQSILPGIHSFFAPIGSTQIRNMATVGGNLVNASPIGDMTIMFLALDSDIVLSSKDNDRTIKLKDFYLGYKQLDKDDVTLVQCIQFAVPGTGSSYHFERVCKRTYLDVASINSACLVQFDDDDKVGQAHLSIGGVAAIPMYLSETSSYLTGKRIEHSTVLEAHELLQEEIAPISDIRGSEEYKRLLARQQFFIHMAKATSQRLSLNALLL